MNQLLTRFINIYNYNHRCQNTYANTHNRNVKPWFDANIPKNWNMIQSEKIILKPKGEVLFGQQGSYRKLCT